MHEPLQPWMLYRMQSVVRLQHYINLMYICSVLTVWPANGSVVDVFIYVQSTLPTQFRLV